MVGAGEGFDGSAVRGGGPNSQDVGPGEVGQWVPGAARGCHVFSIQAFR